MAYWGNKTLHNNDFINLIKPFEKSYMAYLVSDYPYKRV